MNPKKEKTMNDMKKLAKDYSPHMLGVISGGMVVLCLWITVALLQIQGAGLVAFATASGALFWGSGVGLAWLISIERTEREDFARKREELRAQLRGTAL